MLYACRKVAELSDGIGDGRIKRFRRPIRPSAPKDSLLIRRGGNDVQSRQQWTMMEAEIRHLETILMRGDRRDVYKGR
jgi:hypothetical protein